METAFPSSRHLSSPIRSKALSGTAAPIWSKAWRIAAPATRRATRWAPSATARSFPAAMSITGTLMRSTISPTRRCLGTLMPCSPICVTAGTVTTVRRAGRWRRWSKICPRFRQATSAPSRSTWPAYRERRRRIANARTRPRWQPRHQIRHPPLPNPTRPVRRSTQPPARHAMRAVGRCLMAGSIWRSVPRSPAPTRAISPISYYQAFRPSKAKAAQSCPDSPPA